MTQNKQKTKIPTKQKKLSQKSEQTFLDHLYELRKRIAWIALTLVVTSALGFQFKDQLIAAIMSPLHGEKLVYLTPAGGFSFIFTLSIYFGALLTIPVIIFQIYRFLQPLLGKSSKKLATILITLSITLAAAGAAFGYFVTIPAAINFLSTFAGDAVTPNLTAESYLNFVVTYVLGLAALFQLPLLLFLFDHIRPIPPGTLSSTQRFVIIGATIMAAIITPTPDALNMMIVAVPIIIVYEMGALAVFIRRGIRNRAAAKASRAASKLAAIETKSDDTVYEQPLTREVARSDQPTIATNVIVAEKDQVIRRQLPPRSIDGMFSQKQMTSVARTSPAQRRIVTQPTVSERPLRTIDGFFAYKSV
jgi:sec-independent protein translocase protein TatC